MTKFGEKTSLAFIKKEKGQTKLSYEMKFLLPTRNNASLNKLQEAESILIAWISKELDFFSHYIRESSLLESCELIF